MNESLDKSPAAVLDYEGYTIELYQYIPQVDINELKSHYEKFFSGMDESYGASSISGIRVLKNYLTITSCLIASDGRATGIHENSAFINSSSLFICCGSSVYKLSLPDLDLQWVTIADPVTCFGIYPLDDDCLVHGELLISRLGKDGSLIWEQGGRDIWTTINGMEIFTVKDDFIQAIDWDENIYFFDFEGKLLKEILAKKHTK